MQVLYQLSYGPVGIEWLAWRWSPGLARRPCRFDAESLHRSGSAHRRGVTWAVIPGCHTWRQTATSFPWMLTCSASSTIGL